MGLLIQRTGKKVLFLIVSFLVGVTFLTVPLYGGEYLMEMLIIALWFAYMGSCWNIVGGYTGLLSLGHGTFVGVGAYTSTLLFMHLNLTPWVGMLAGALLATLVGILVGYLSFRFRVRGVYFALITMAMAEILRLIFEHVDFLGATVGIFIKTLKGPGGAVFYQFGPKWPYYLIILGMTGGILLVSYFIENSKLGYFLRAIKENEEAARSLGVSAIHYQILAMALSSFFIALGGTFYAQYRLYIRPDLVMGVHFSVDIVMGPIIGGWGTLLGPIVGSLIMTPLGELTRWLTEVARETFRIKGLTGLHMITYGIVLVLVVRFMPNGIVGLYQRRKDLRKDYGTSKS
jgi:branched-chain amino acid transport system permease protein